MTPVMQDKFEHTFKYGGGNCLQAVIASLLDLPLEAVPHFMLFGEQWWDALCLFLKSRGRQLYGYVTEPPPCDDTFYLTKVDFPNIDYAHCIITRNGELIHDPHPSKSREGETITGYYKIVPEFK